MALRGAEYLSRSPGRSLHGPALALQLTRNPPSLPKASCNSLSARASFRNDERCVLAYLQRAVYPPKNTFETCFCFPRFLFHKPPCCPCPEQRSPPGVLGHFLFSGPISHRGQLMIPWMLLLDDFFLQERLGSCREEMQSLMDGTNGPQHLRAALWPTPLGKLPLPPAALQITLKLGLFAKFFFPARGLSHP